MGFAFWWAVVNVAIAGTLEPDVLHSDPPLYPSPSSGRCPVDSVGDLVIDKEAPVDVILHRGRALFIGQQTEVSIFKCSGIPCRFTKVGSFPATPDGSDYFRGAALVDEDSFAYCGRWQCRYDRNTYPNMYTYFGLSVAKGPSRYLMPSRELSRHRKQHGGLMPNGKQYRMTLLFVPYLAGHHHLSKKRDFKA